MPEDPMTKRTEPTRDQRDTFCPEEVVDRVVDLFIVRERTGRAVEKQLGIRRPLFELELRHAINRERDPLWRRSVERAGVRGCAVRRSA